MSTDNVEVTVDQKAKTVTIVLPLQEPTESKSGKSLTIATTHGNMRSNARFKGKTVTIGANAYIPND